MIVGACVLPSAPLLVAGVRPDSSPAVAVIAEAIDTAVAGQRRSDAAVLVAPGPRTGVHADARVDLAGIGRGDIAEDHTPHRGAVAGVATALDVEPVWGHRLPLGLAVLALLLGAGPAVVPVTIADDVDFDTATAVGAAIADVGDAHAWDLAVCAAGDLSAGHGPSSPRPDVAGAGDYDRQVTDAIDTGRLGDLARLGPEWARRVHAVGWPSLVALHGVVRTAELSLVRRCYGAPCGVGYLVAHGG
jgi:hypothetical protein